MMIQYSVGANFVSFVTNWLRNSSKMKEYPDDIRRVRIWAVKLSGDISTVEMDSQNRVRLGLGLVMNVQIKTGSHGTAAPLFDLCLLRSNG